MGWINWTSDLEPVNPNVRNAWMRVLAARVTGARELSIHS